MTDPAPTTGKRTYIDWRDPDSGLTLTYASIEPGASPEAILHVLSTIKWDIRGRYGDSAAETVTLRGAVPGPGTERSDGDGD